MIKPFIKWAGGKRQLINDIRIRLPKNFNNFFEPFVGGGALFFELRKKNTLINDISKELINAYEIIKKNPFELIDILDKMKKNHELNPREYFYKIRNLDRDIDKFNKMSKEFLAARFIYLNKTCFNGLYRVNLKGLFNVPFNNKEKVNLYEKENIFQISNYLNQKNIIIKNEDFETACQRAKKGDFLFFDPPYDILKEDSFTKYTKNGFDRFEQKRLAELAKKLKEKGCYVMITNHDTKFIRELYSKDFKIDVINVRRNINSKGNKRTGEEVIIYNY